MNRLDWAIVVLAFACLGLAARITQAPAQLYPIHDEYAPVIVVESVWQQDDYVVSTWYGIDPETIHGVFGPYPHWVMDIRHDQMKLLVDGRLSDHDIWLPDVGSPEDNRILWTDAYTRFADARANGLISGQVSFASFLRH